MGDFFFIHKRKIIKKEGHVSHISETVYEEVYAERTGIVKPNVFEEETPDEMLFYIEVPGVKDKEKVSAELEHDIIKVRAKPTKKIVLPSIASKEEFEEYRIAIKVPEGTSPDNIKLKLLPDKGILLIRVKKKSTKNLEIK